MSTQVPSPRFALRAVPDRGLADGAWWPESRSLGDELTGLFSLWPAEAGRIVRVLYSPPDWDDRPRSVAVPGRRIKTGSFPRDDTHQLTLSMLDGRRRSITVIPSDTPADVAGDVLDAVTSSAGAPASGNA